MKNLRQHQRVAVFADVQNIYYGAKKIFNSKIDFKNLLQRAVSDRQFVRAISYVVSKEDIDASSFINLLRDIGFEVKIKNLRERSDGSVKGNWDIQMAMDMVAMADKVEVIVLISGDGDFVPVVEWLQHKGVYVELYSFKSSTALDLIEKVDRFIEID